MKKVLSLFSGIGGLDLGLERTGGFETIRFCEIEPYPCAVLTKHWPKVPISPDICLLKGADIGPVDVVVGGFPCQDISPAGKGAGLEGCNSGLWFEYLRIISETRPGYVIIENSATLRTRGLVTVLQGLAGLGYAAEWYRLRASQFGAPHHRARTYIIAYPERDEQSRQEPRYGALGRVGREQQSAPWDATWKSALRRFRRMDDGLSYKVDRVETLRNAAVPQIAEAIGREILDYELKNPQPREGYRFVRNIMSGKMIEEAIGTPFSCSVSSEAYWSS